MAEEAVEPATRVTHEEPDRDLLIRELWPDKALYASVILFVTGFVGIVNGVVRFMVDLSYSSRVPAVITNYPSQLTLALSVVAAAFAYMALIQKRTHWTVLGAAAGIVSFGFVAVNLVLSLVALGFVAWSRREGEEDNPATQVLTADMWPDKTLAASLLMLIASVLTLVWGVGITLDLISYGGYLGPTWLFGIVATVIGIAGLVAARSLYFQRGSSFATGIGLMTMAMVAFWVLGPALAAGALVLMSLGRQEDEFEDEATALA